MVEGTFIAMAPAKINIHLEIQNKRGDGFHNIVSLFQKVALYDEITVTIKNDKKLSINCNGGANFENNNNTLVKSALLFGKMFDLKVAINISVNKRIPIGSGLGGPSSDAAAVLKLLNSCWDFPLNEEQLIELALQVGSDVPFFIKESSAALVSGRGEFVSPIRGRDDLHLLIVTPKSFFVSTKEAYEYRFEKNREPIPLSELEALYNQKISSWPFYNDFKEYLNIKSSFYNVMAEETKEFTDCFCSVSGSGSSFIVIGENRGVLAEIEAKLGRVRLEFSQYLTKCLH